MIEQRSVASSVTWRDGRSSAESASITGHAAVFEQETTIDLGIFAFREKVARGAFKRAITTDDVRALFNHSPDHVLGRTKNRTLTLAEDRVGLHYSATPPKTTAADDVRELIRGGYVSGSSFAFTVGPDDDAWDESGLKHGKLPLRTIVTVRSLLDVSPVTYPAYVGTDTQARGVTTMREKTTDGTVRLPAGYKRILKRMETDLVCARCRRHVGLGWTVRGADALHVECAELHDMQAERRELSAWADSQTPAGMARMRAAEAALAAAQRWRV